MRTEVYHKRRDNMLEVLTIMLVGFILIFVPVGIMIYLHIKLMGWDEKINDNKPFFWEDSDD
jgi:hypothetical protein